MTCALFGHKPYLGFSTRWKLKSYHVFNFVNPRGWDERRIYRTHVCERCGSRYYEVKHVDYDTEMAIAESNAGDDK